MNRTGTRISVGENYQARQPLVRDLPQHVAQIQIAQHTEEQDCANQCSNTQVQLKCTFVKQ